MAGTTPKKGNVCHGDQKGDMEVSYEPPLGGRARAALQRLWHMGPSLCMYHGPTTTLRGWKPPGHGTGSANCCCSALGSAHGLGRRAAVLTAEPGFKGVAPGSGVSMWPPCKERENRVSLGHASLSHTVCISSDHTTTDTGCSGQLRRQGLEKDKVVDGGLCLGTKL